MTDSPIPQATVVIVTKNRKDDLRRALTSTFMQAGLTFDVLVFDDASTDGTPEMVRAEFPTARVHLSDVSTGHIVHRNRGTELARSPIVVIIDDDSAFEHPDTLARSVAEFDDPAIGALAIPFINDGDSHITQQAPDTNHTWVTYKFIGAAHALRKDAFLKVGGYRTELVHFGEEADLCARLLQTGYVTRLGNAPPARHFLSPIRNRTWERYYAARAGIVTSYMNMPVLMVVPALLGWTTREVLLIARHGKPGATLKGIAGGYRDILRHAGKRRPISWNVQKVLRQLKNHGPMTLQDVRHTLRHVIT